MAEVPEIVDAKTAKEAESALFNDLNLVEAAKQEQLNLKADTDGEAKAVAFARLRNEVRFALEGAEQCDLNSMLGHYFDVAEQAGRIRQRTLLEDPRGLLGLPEVDNALNSFQFRFQSAVQSILAKSSCFGSSHSSMHRPS